MDKAQFKFALGSTARDTITGFTGVIVARTQWLHGCTRYSLQPTALDKDGKPLEAATFDEPQLEAVNTKTRNRLSTSEGGGPRPEPRRW